MITNTRLDEASQTPEILTLDEIRILAKEVLRSRKFIRQLLEKLEKQLASLLNKQFIADVRIANFSNFSTDIRPIIEVYFDPNGCMCGQAGCFRARLQDSHGLHDAGMTPEDAVKYLLINIKCFSDYRENGELKYAHLPHELEKYTLVRLDAITHCPISIPWNQRDKKEEKKHIEDARQVFEMVSFMLLNMDRNENRYSY